MVHYLNISLNNTLISLKFDSLERAKKCESILWSDFKNDGIKVIYVSNGEKTYILNKEKINYSNILDFDL